MPTIPGLLIAVFYVALVFAWIASVAAFVAVVDAAASLSPQSKERMKEDEGVRGMALLLFVMLLCLIVLAVVLVAI